MDAGKPTPNGCCKIHSGIDTRVEHLENRADKHDRKLDTIDTRTAKILGAAIVILVGTVINLLVTLFSKGGV